MVIGCPGSGKSTFSRALHAKTGIPLFYLDRLNWNSDKTTVEKSIFRERLQHIIRKDAWIIDGNYGSTLEMRLQACDTVFFLDYPLEVCLRGIAERKGKAREDMPWVEEEADAAFLNFIREYPTRGRAEVLDLLGRYSHKDIHIFGSREEADRFLGGL